MAMSLVSCFFDSRCRLRIIQSRFRRVRVITGKPTEQLRAYSLKFLRETKTSATMTRCVSGNFASWCTTGVGTSFTTNPKEI